MNPSSEEDPNKPYLDPALNALKLQWHQARQVTPSVTQQYQPPPAAKASIMLFTLKILIYVLLIAALSAIGIAVSKPIENYYTLKDANPLMVQLANDANMSRQGKLVFLQTHPQLDSPAQFIKDCTTADSNKIGTAVLGCYIPDSNRIYILKMPAEFYDAEVNTAAYEMLHSVYLQFTQPSSKQLDQVIESNYRALSSNASLVSQVSMFAKTEPESRDLELFSILGTEYSGISPQLASYYAAYFSDDLKAVVKDNQQVISLFQNYQDQINQLKANISQDEVKAANDYATSVSWANAGNKYEDTAYYNLYKQDYNAVITVITRYNQLVDNYNTLVTAYSGGQPISQIQSTTKSPLK